ncbi:MAG TPA: tripartite tricarboxylate transporter substrate-binding protein [Hyphomicrobiaceae bacterium]|jgi:putative tricarboxylic transport membrane protein|nr:tripartite tricarboxylate transporter substrate-binding protein [Hyphomicrobiaceae bacterium]
MISRRVLVKGWVAAAAAAQLGPWGARRASAQAPTSLQMFIPAAPGGGWDQTGRTIELAMRTDGIVKEFRFEHAPGAGGAVGLPRFLAAKKGQGDALLVGGMVMVGALVANKSPVSMRDMTPIARLTGEFEVVVVNEASPLKSMQDLVAMFKADPGKVSWAGGSAGGTDHILAGMIAKAVGVDPKRVSYVAYAGGGPAQAALLGNQVTCGVSGYGEFAEQIKAGKLRALGISAGQPLDGIAIPTLKAQGIDVELANWRGVFGAPGLSAAQQAALVGLIERMVQGPTWQAELKKRDWAGIFLAGAAFGAFVDSEIARITGILKELGLAA